MATGIICIILIMVCVLGIKSYAKKLTHGCCGGEDVTVKQVKPVDKDLSHYPYTYELQIKGMTCKNCKIRIQNMFNSQEGFWAKVDLRKGCAAVRSKQPANETDLKQMIEELGYTVVKIEK